jgi:hypothetical protein
MAQLTDEQRDRIREERTLLVQGLPRPEVQMVFRKLDEAADAMLLRYDLQDFIKEPAKAIYIQCFRDIIKKEIPRIFETILNIDTQPTAPQWSFRRWLGLKLKVMADRLSA